MEERAEYIVSSKKGVHVKPDAIACDLKGCLVFIQNPKHHQRFCCPEHKDEHHRIIRKRASKMAVSKKPHCGTLQNSARLRIMLRALSDCREHTTRELQEVTGDVAVHSTISDLRHNCFNIKRRYVGRTKAGRHIKGIL